MIRIGVVGLGMMGTMHIGAHEKIAGAQLAAICDKDQKRAGGDFSDAWSNLGDTGVKQLDMSTIKGTTELGELLEMDDIDMIDICLPTPFHVDAAIAAIESGKHVLCEKPLARTAADARKIADAAANAKGLFMPAMCMRFWPQWRWLKDAVDTKKYGNVLGASFYRMASMPPGWFSNGEWSGGALIDLHIHDTDFIYHLLGKPTAVRSVGYSKTSGCTDHISTQYLYNEGPALVTAMGGWCLADAFSFKMRYVVNFENATATFDIGAEHPLLLAHEGEEKPIDMEGDGYTAEISYFLDCIQSKTRPSIVTAEDAVTSIEICEAEQRSIDTGAAVELG